MLFKERTFLQNILLSTKTTPDSLGSCYTVLHWVIDICLVVILFQAPLTSETLVILPWYSIAIYCACELDIIIQSGMKDTKNIPTSMENISNLEQEQPNVNFVKFSKKTKMKFNL